MKSAEPMPDTISREQFARVRLLFEQACGLGDAERQAFLDRECPDDVTVRSRVQELLQTGDDSGHSCDPDSGEIVRQILQPLAAPVTLTQVDAYRIIRIVGQGGMGTVYLAEQSHPERLVALKVLRADRRGSLVSRFGREVRVLGRLEHPGIARIYDAGSATTPEGVISYFAMEYVQGPRLTEFAESKALDTRSRVELMARVADAVQHAHTKGVIHRDLKPANILVADPGAECGADRSEHPGGLSAQPKVLDFGVARVLEAGQSQAEIAEQGVLIGTMAYMSPEQFAGDNDSVDARADVYALGVILYELLTRRLPHDLVGKSIAEAACIVRDTDAAPLNSPGGPRTGRLDRDIEFIVRRATAKERERRYATVAAFADDLRRYLLDEPIAARPPSVAYQASKFVRRHRGVVIAATAALLALVCGLFVSSVLYVGEREARQREQLARLGEHQANLLASQRARLSAQVQGYLVDDVLLAASPDRQGYDVKLIDVLLDAGKDLHERFADDPLTEAEIRASLAKTLVSLGKTDEGAAQWRQAVPLLEQTVGPDDPATITALMGCGAGNVMGNFRAALAYAEEALARARRALPDGHPVKVEALRHVGVIHGGMAHYRQAIQYYEEALEQAKLAPDPDSSAAMSIMGSLMGSEEASGNHDAAIRLARKVVSLAPAGPIPVDENVVRAPTTAMWTLNANALTDEALPIAERLTAAVERAESPPRRGITYRRLSLVFGAAGRFEDAERYGLLSYESQRMLLRDRVNEDTERCINNLCAIYSRWPGHDTQLREWSVQAARVRMMRATPRGLARILAAFDPLKTGGAAAAVSLDADAMLETIWGRRDEFVPQGCPARATFFANYARACVAKGKMAHVPEAISLANRALRDATNQAKATELISAAQDEAKAAAQRIDPR